MSNENLAGASIGKIRAIMALVLVAVGGDVDRLPRPPPGHGAGRPVEGSGRNHIGSGWGALGGPLA